MTNLLLSAPSQATLLPSPDQSQLPNGSAKKPGKQKPSLKTLTLNAAKQKAKTMPSEPKPEAEAIISGAVKPADGPAVASKPAEPDPGPPELLVRILATRRRHNTAGDRGFRLWLFNYIRTQLGVQPEVREEGVIFVRTDPKSTVLFSCHVDTVHGTAESESGEAQELLYDPNFAHLYLNPTSKSGCLGGDDGVGIYIMLEMIRRKIPGSYVFHTGEECGGIGARAFVGKNGKWLGDTFEQVVAFDRPVYDDANPEVIITQGGRPCASIEYGKALAEALNAIPFEKPYVTSTKGVFTDSKIYADDVPECVNLGCFYNKQHGPNEVVDCFGVGLLLEAACTINWAKLPIVRKAMSESYQSQRGDGLSGGYNSGGKGFEAPSPKPQQKQQSIFQKPKLTLLEELNAMALEDMQAFVEEEPDSATKALLALLARSEAQSLHIAYLERALGLT